MNPEQLLQDFKTELMVKLGGKSIESLIGLLEQYIYMQSLYESKRRIFEGKSNNTFEYEMMGLKNFREDLSKMLKNIGQK